MFSRIILVLDMLSILPGCVGRCLSNLLSIHLISFPYRIMRYGMYLLPATCGLGLLNVLFWLGPYSEAGWKMVVKLLIASVSLKLGLAGGFRIDP